MGLSGGIWQYMGRPAQASQSCCVSIEAEQRCSSAEHRQGGTGAEPKLWQLSYQAPCLVDGGSDRRPAPVKPKPEADA